jgi:SAM-dependent methyltransferase
VAEIIRREVAQNPQPFTGERLTSAIDGQVQIEHYHRYLFARALVRELDVLDVACGEGYGAALLAQVARSVVGVDCSHPTVQNAIANFPRSNLNFLQADARALPLQDACIDTVVSFETIEHIDRQNEFLREMRRVLRPDGCIIVSTPDRDEYSVANPYHVQELNSRELVTLLHENFRHVVLLQQRPLMGSALLGEFVSPLPPLVFDRRDAAHFEAHAGMPHALYLVAVASDRAPPPLPSSLYIERSDIDTDRLAVVTLSSRLNQTETSLARTEANLAQNEARLAQSEARLVEAIGRTRTAEQARADASARAETLQHQLSILQSSLRTFVRGYLPILYRHLRGHRP